MMFRYIALVKACLLLTLADIRTAQETFTVSGYVKDAADGEALPGVNIVVPALERSSPIFS